MRILFIALDFRTWENGRHLSYCAQLGLEEGMAASNIDFMTITTPWVGRIKDILGEKKFDQVWVEMVHTNLDEALLNYLSKLAPVRVGFILESLNYSPEEQSVYPFLKDRRELVAYRVRYFTHVVACDEMDVHDFNNEYLIPTFWWPQAVPSRYVSQGPNMIKENYATFSGALYGQRESFLKHHLLKDLLIQQGSPERGTPYPFLFNCINIPAYLSTKIDLINIQGLLPAYLKSLRYIRRHCFSLWLKGMQKGCAVVNLPHYVKTYAGRVVEGMAAGRAVISWEIPNRPRNKVLFVNNEEILLFNSDSPQQLADHIQRLSFDHDFNKKIVNNAIKKIKSFHTVERRVAQILEWINKGQEPVYE